MDWFHGILLAIATFQAGFLFSLFLLTIIFITLITINEDKQHKQAKVNTDPIITRPHASDSLIFTSADTSSAAADIKKANWGYWGDWGYSTIFSLTNSVYISSQWCKYARGLKKSLKKALNKLD